MGHWPGPLRFDRLGWRLRSQIVGCEARTPVPDGAGDEAGQDYLG